MYEIVKKGQQRRDWKFCHLKRGEGFAFAESGGLLIKLCDFGPAATLHRLVEG